MSYLSYQIRDGTRGGRDQFNWDDVRQMSHKDREMYLGQSLKIGFLDKGGKWRKKDWYLQGEKLSEAEIEAMIESERKKVANDDQRRIRVALGLEKEEKKTISETATEEEKMRLLKEIKEGMDFGKVEVNQWDDIQENDEQRGIGFKLSSTQLSKVKETMDISKFLNYDPTRLEAVGIEEEPKDKEKLDSKARKAAKHAKKEAKKDKKKKKHKSEKHSKKDSKHRHRSRSESDDSDDSDDSSDSGDNGKRKAIKKDKKHKKDSSKSSKSKKEKEHRRRHDSSSSERDSRR